MHWVKLWSLEGTSAILAVLFAVAPLFLWNRYTDVRGRIWAIANVCACVTMAVGHAISLRWLVNVGIYCFSASLILILIHNRRRPPADI